MKRFHPQNTDKDRSKANVDEDADEVNSFSLGNLLSISLLTYESACAMLDKSNINNKTYALISHDLAL
ncbi:CLUMA_CG013874, isoform A [Clunio marinus]|uniref:CLUMA_CG013874, isoform A n=1 Tax=Clunio marinus TaxID=568069 RepID=A0A1J1INE3_9DIPT|nr:CLUMA_CG013874, isoform A [Clunio marinus]